MKKYVELARNISKLLCIVIFCSLLLACDKNEEAKYGNNYTQITGILKSSSNYSFSLAIGSDKNIHWDEGRRLLFGQAGALYQIGVHFNGNYQHRGGGGNPERHPDESIDYYYLIINGTNIGYTDQTYYKTIDNKYSGDFTLRCYSYENSETRGQSTSDSIADSGSFNGSSIVTDSSAPKINSLAIGAFPAAYSSTLGEWECSLGKDASKSSLVLRAAMTDLLDDGSDGSGLSTVNLVNNASGVSKPMVAASGVYSVSLDAPLAGC
jgi:hypothetical protein